MMIMLNIKLKSLKETERRIPLLIKTRRHKKIKKTPAKVKAKKKEKTKEKNDSAYILNKN
jgi:hypothetical protein